MRAPEGGRAVVDMAVGHGVLALSGVDARLPERVDLRAGERRRRMVYPDPEHGRRIEMRIRESLSRVIGRHHADTPGQGERSGNAAEPFPDYDRIDEKELIDRFHLYSQAELEAIEAYERTHDNRIRVLNKLHYLRQSEPLPDYDALSVEEIAAALEEEDLATIKNVRAYERKFHNRQNVQDVVEACRLRLEAEVGAGGGTVGYHATSYGPSTSHVGSRSPGPGQLAANKDLVTLFHDEVINAHDLDAVDRLVGDEIVQDGEVRSRSDHRMAVSELLSAFPDLRVKTDLILAEGDLVSVHQRWTGTHRETAGGVEPTDRPVEFTSTAVFRIRDGLIAETWDEVDLAGMVTRLDDDD
jgi:predicted ester cyclase